MDAEYHKRQNEKVQRKQAAFQKNLKNLRKRTRTSLWNEKDVPEKHIHQFERVSSSLQKCCTCSLEVECEEL